MSVKAHLRITSAVVLIASAVVVGMLVTRDPRPSVPADEMASSTVDPEELVQLGRTRVFFGHQSVGQNLLDGVARVYALQGVRAPAVEELPRDATATKTSGGGTGGFLAHAYIGENGDPLGKVAEFDRIMRSGVAREVDVALMKFCYSDITRETDVDAVFGQYRDSLATLEQDFPDVAFLHLTSPLTREADLETRVKAGIKKVVGREDASAANNVARERFNALMRREYSTDRLFDIAALESTTPDGATVSGTYGDERYLALYAGYSSDATGHLNEAGSQIAAAGLLDAIARTVEPAS